MMGKSSVDSMRERHPACSSNSACVCGQDSLDKTLSKMTQRWICSTPVLGSSVTINLRMSTGSPKYWQTLSLSTIVVMNFTLCCRSSTLLSLFTMICSNACVH